MFQNGREAASNLGMANGKTMKLAAHTARAVENARIRILAMDVLAAVMSGLESIHLAVRMDGGSMLMSVAMKVWKIESVIRLGLPERGTIAMCRKARNTARALKTPFNKTAVSVCFTRNLACLRDMMKTSGWLRTLADFEMNINTKRNLRFVI
jgi:hypothetical protein